MKTEYKNYLIDVRLKNNYLHVFITYYRDFELDIGLITEEHANDKPMFEKWIEERLNVISDLINNIK